MCKKRWKTFLCNNAVFSWFTCKTLELKKIKSNCKRLQVAMNITTGLKKILFTFTRKRDICWKGGQSQCFWGCDKSQGVIEEGIGAYRWKSYELGSIALRLQELWSGGAEWIISLKGKTNHSLSWTRVFYVVWINFLQNFVKMIVTRSLRSKKSIEKNIFRLDSMKPKLCWPCLRSKRQHQDRTIYPAGFGEIMLYS